MLQILLTPITLISCVCFSELIWIRLYRRPNIVAGSRMTSFVFFPGPLWVARCRSCDPPPPIAVACRGTEAPTALFGLNSKKHQSGFLARFRPKTAGAGTARATLFGGTEDADLLKRYRDMGAARVVVTLPPETADKTLRRWADLIRRVNA
jgi:hypothetical protein